MRMVKHPRNYKLLTKTEDRADYLVKYGEDSNPAYNRTAMLLINLPTAGPSDKKAVFFTKKCILVAEIHRLPWYTIS